MPGTFNPVSGNPVASVSHSKSFRSLLGFGGNNGGGSSIKPSFFSQLNLKAGRRSFGGPSDFHANDRPVLVIDPEPDYETTRQENRVLLNDDTRTTRLEQLPFSSSPTKETSDRSSYKFTHSLPAIPIDTQIPSYSLNSHTDLDLSLARGLTAESRVDPDASGFSKHLPDLSNDFSLLIDEQLPSDTASQSDHPDSQVSPESHQDIPSLPPLPRSPQKIEGQDVTQRVYTTSPTLSPLPRGGRELSNSGPLSNSGDASMDTTASFDLSSARLSLDLIRQEFGEEWAKTVVVESGSAPSAGTSALLSAESSFMGSNGPITSTPFRNPRAPPFGSQQKEPEVSFNLEALDPDLVALLRQSNANKGPPRTHLIAPSALEPFAPPPDPLNPGTAAKHLAVSASPPPSPPLPSAPTKREASTPSPARKFATISTSTSPAKQLRLHRSQIDQDVFSPSNLPKPASAPAISSDLHWEDNRRHSGEQPSPSSAMTYSEVVTPSDISKPSPLSAMPVTLDDLKRNPGSNAIQSSIASSTSTWNNTTRRKGRTPVPLPIQSPRPVSTLTPYIDSRPSSYHMHRNRDRDSRPASASPEVHAPYTHPFGSTSRGRDHVRPPVNGLFSKQPSPDRGAGYPSSAGAGQLPNTFHERMNSNDALLHSQDRDRGSPSSRRYRKRSMSLVDQRSSGLEGRADDLYSQGGFHPRFRGRDREGVAESVGHTGSEYAYSVTSGLGTPYDGRDVEKDRERYLYGNGYHERERPGRLHTDWLGPRTVKAFAAAGLLDDAKDIPGSRYGAFSRSTSDRDFRTPGAESNRDRRSPVRRGYPSLDVERDRRYSVATSGRSSDRDFRASGVRSGTMSPSTVVSARTLSRNDSWSSRPPQVLARTISDVLSQRGSTDGRDSASGVHPRTGSVYSAGGGGTAGGSTGSGGGRASPTTTSSHIAIQPQIQALKEKHDIQTEALLAALADSQRTAREMKEENDSLKSQVRSLEERLVEAIASFRQKEKELSRVLRNKRQSSPDRTRIAVSHFESQSSLNSRNPPPKQLARPTPSTKRRFSTTSSVFPPIPGSMSLLMAETPGPQHDSGTSSSPPASPTLVLPKLSSKQKSPERQRHSGDHMLMSSSQPVSISHKRSTSGASVATSTNFSFETGSPGSLKLKPEHELLLGDMTRFSLATGFDGDSEVET